MESLLTRKTIVSSANADQISFIIDLMHGYDRSKLTDRETIMDESYFPNNPRNVLPIKAQRIFPDTKKN